MAPREHFRTCNLCEAMCGIAVVAGEDRVLDLRGDAADPFSRGHICPKAVALKDVHEDPDRLRVPLRRTGDRWEEIGWAEAFDEAARRIREVQERYGNSALAVYQGNPTVHNTGSMIFGHLFFRALRTRNRYSATSLDQLPHMLAALKMYGHQLLMPIPDIDRTSYFLILGANPAVSNGSLMTAPDAARRIRGIRSRGGKVTVIDPRFTETAALADRHAFIQPGTDAYLLLALLHVVLQDRGPRLGRLEAFTHGLEQVQKIAAPWTPERVAARTGIAADEIRTIAKELSEAPSAVVYGRVGLSMQEFGGLCQWLINVLNIVTGNLDRPGGAMFTTPAIDLVAITRRIGQAGHFDRRRSRVRQLPEFGGEYPAAALAEEIDTPGEGQIRGLITSAGNPVLSAPNGRRLDRALAGLESMIAIDFYLNETTRHAHLILPPTSPLEHSHYDLAFHLLAVRNTAKYSPPLFPRPASARHDWEIFAELTSRLKKKSRLEGLLDPLSRRMMLRLGPEPVLDLALRLGPHRLSMRRLRAAPHGIDLGPLEPRLPERLCTADRRIDLAPECFVADLPRLEARFALAPAPAGDQLALIGRRELRSNNSWMHNSARLSKGRARCVLQMHPEDASRRGLVDGQSVRVKSRTGEIEVPLAISSEMMPGVVSLPHGWGHDRAGIRLSIAAKRPGSSLNDLTDEALLDDLSGTVRFSGVPVDVVSAEQSDGRTVQTGRTTLHS